MESLIELLRERRSVRRFQEKKVEKELVETLIESALRSPSSRSLNPWEFIVVDDPDVIEKLATAKAHGSKFMKNAPLAIVVCADPSRCDVWIEDTSIATLLIHLAAADIGLGSCWVQVRLRGHDDQQSAEEYVREVLSIPDNVVVEAMVAIGYPEKVPAGHPKSSLLYERVRYNSYGGSE